MDKSYFRIPEPTRKRLIMLLQLLHNCNTEKITSVQIANRTGWKSSLIRYDISCIGLAGGVSNGYRVKELEKQILTALELYQTQLKKCCIVGLGRLGAAILDEDFFRNSGFTVVAGFDSSVNRTEILHSTFPLFPASKIETVVPAEKIEFAILAVHEKEADLMTERLVKCRIKGIVNFTSSVLTVPKTVKVENISPITALKVIAGR